MTPFVLLSAALALLAVAWLTRPLWWPPAPAPRSTVLAAVLALFVLGIGGAGYAWLGTPAQLGIGPGTSPEEASAASRAQAEGQVLAMIEQLTQRLKAQPDDANGWMMLARSYGALGRHAESAQAWRKAVMLRPEDAGMLADLALAVAMANNRQLDGEPAQLIERALKADPQNRKVLAFAGMLAFERKDYALAVKHWEKVEQLSNDGGAGLQPLRNSIAEARRLAGMAPPPAGAAAPAAAAQVAGSVSLAPALKDRVSPEDTVFIFARAAEGPRVPLAILRKRVADLPLAFTLDDSLAMSPAARLSGAARVIVGARVSKSGNAMAQPGDLQGLSAPVPVGTNDLRIEIADVVR
jgi:cytochrome c-type biogenesis protein CcmH